MKLLTFVLLCSVVGWQTPAPTSPNNPATIMTGFLERAKAYAELRDGLAKGEARQTRTGHPERHDLLAARVQAARPNAKMGDLFMAETRPIFRKLLSPQLKGREGAENKKSLNDEDDETDAIRIKVNAPYPKGESIASVPPDILAALPVLPKDLEYRFVRKNLILYDARSSLVVDVLPNAIP
jgi:hypothetical protein